MYVCIYIYILSTHTKTSGKKKLVAPFNTQPPALLHRSVQTPITAWRARPNSVFAPWKVPSSSSSRPENLETSVGGCPGGGWLNSPSLTRLMGIESKPKKSLT